MENLCIWNCVCLTLCIAYSLPQKHRNEYFDMNSTVNLTCANKNLSSILLTVWKIHMKNSSCIMASTVDEDKTDTCKDGKALHRMNNGEYYLHIPRFTKKDEGLYHCVTVYTGGRHIAHIKVYTRASLSISTWLDVDHRVAVCSATGATQNVSISWRTSWNSTGNQTRTLNPDGTYDMENSVSLPDAVNETNLKCTVTHPGWNKSLAEILHVPGSARMGSSPHLWLWIVISLCSICFLTGVLTALYIIRKHLSKIRSCKFSLPHPPPLQTVVKPEDVEELEPYASYVQRVNSIYNSSVEHCSV